MAEGAFSRKRKQRGSKIVGLGMARIMERSHHRIDGPVATMRRPNGIDGGVDQASLGIVQPVLEAGHLRNDGFEHCHAIDEVVLVLTGLV